MSTITVSSFVVSFEVADTDDSGHDFTVYDAYLDTQGLIFYEADDALATTRSAPLRPVRQDVGNNPFELRPESGDIFGQGDFSHGSGQTYYHREERNPKRFLTSEGFDISEPGSLTHLHKMAQVPTGSVPVTARAIVQAADLPFAAAGTDVYRGNGSFPGTWVAEDPSGAEGAQTVEDLTVAGAEIFAALGTAGIHKRDSAGTWAHYQISAADVNVGTATRVAWVKDRLMAVGGTNSRSIYEVAVAAPTPIETLPEGWRFEDIFEAGGFIYACAVNENAGLSRVHHYGLNSAGNAIEKKGSTPLPPGQLAYSGLGYLTTLYLGVGKRTTSGGYDPVIYVGQPDEQGFFGYAKLAEGEGAVAVDLAVRALSPLGETVLFGWSQGVDHPDGRREGLAQHHPARDAVVNSYKRETPANPAAAVRGILIYKDRVLFTVEGAGLWYQDIATYVPQATLTSSVADWSSAGQKVWDTVEVAHRPLQVGTSVRLDFTKKHPKEADWQTGLISDVQGAEGASGTLTAVKSRLFAVRLLSNADSTGTRAPELLSFTVRSNPIPAKPEYIITRFVRLIDRDRKDDDAEQVFIDPPKIRRFLHDAVYSWVKFYEPGATWTARIEQVSDMEPAQPLIGATGGDPQDEAYVIQVVMLGTRDA